MKRAPQEVEKSLELVAILTHSYHQKNPADITELTELCAGLVRDLGALAEK